MAHTFFVPKFACSTPSSHPAGHRRRFIGIALALCSLGACAKADVDVDVDGSMVGTGKGGNGAACGGAGGGFGFGLASGGTSKAKFQIATVEARGAMVFWAAKPAEVGKKPEDLTALTDSELRGSAVGDESTVSTLKIPDVAQSSREQSGNPRTVRCIGCHVATPDGQYVAFTDHWPWNSVIAGVKPRVVGKPLPQMSAGGLPALNRQWGGAAWFRCHSCTSRRS